MTVRCVIVDDSPAVLRAASELLEGEGIAVVGVAATGDEAVRLIDELEPDVFRSKLSETKHKSEAQHPVEPGG
jgi:CheY-like chemotaxis protein